MIKPTRIQTEKELTSVRIPLDKGLLGYRILLIRKDDQDIVCPKCSSPMKIIAIIMDPEETEKILRHLV